MFSVYWVWSEKILYIFQYEISTITLYNTKKSIKLLSWNCTIPREWHKTTFVLSADAQTVYGVFRYDKSRGDPCPGERLPYAASGLLPSRALWHHAGVLEEQARGQAHLWVPAEYTGGLLHCHREPVSATALRHTHTHTHLDMTLILIRKKCTHMPFIHAKPVDFIHM